MTIAESTLREVDISDSIDATIMETNHASQANDSQIPVKLEAMTDLGQRANSALGKAIVAITELSSLLPEDADRVLAIREKLVAECSQVIRAALGTTRSIIES